MNFCALQTSLKILFLQQDSSAHCSNGQSSSISGILAKHNTCSSRPGMGVAGYPELPQNTSEAICTLLRQQSIPSHITDSSCREWTALAFLYSGIRKYSHYSTLTFAGMAVYRQRRTKEWHHHMMLESFPQLLAPRNGTIYSRDINQIIATTVGQQHF